jgi:hypothetical protein
MNSLVIDWQAKLIVERNLNFFLLESLRLPALDRESVAAIASASARLSCVDDRFSAFADVLGVSCGHLDDAVRTNLRIEIDARVVRAAALTEPEIEIVLEAFSTDAISEDYREALRKRVSELSRRS